FGRVQAGELPLDRTIDIVPSLGLTAANIRKRLNCHLRTLRQLLDELASDFAAPVGAGAGAARSKLRQAWRRRVRRAVVVAEELSPRIELVNRWADDLRQQAARPGAPAERRGIVLQVRALPEELTGLLRVIAQRRALYQRARRELAEANLRLVVAVAK